MNTLALRGDLSGNPSFIDFLAKMKRTCLEAYRHQDLPFEYLVDELNVPRDPSRHPIFQVMFVVRDLEEMAVIGLEGIKTCPVKYESRIAKFDLIFDLFFLENGLGCEIEYNTDLYAEESIQQLAQHFKVLLKNIVADPQTKIHELSILTAAEQQHILIDWNQTQHPLPQKTIQELFEEQVAKSPNHIALVYEKQHVTYHELNAKVNQLAHTIRKLYLKEFNQTSLRDSMIGLCTERSLEMIIGILAIIKAGAAYVPIDPAYPEQRIKFMLQDTKTLLLLTQTKVLQKLKFIPETIRHYICLDDQQEKASSKNLTCKNTLNDLCYVIYTSGSTGVPKGVMIEQRGVINLVHAQQQHFRIHSPTDRVLQFASISFDASVLEIFTSLLNGVSLYIVPELVRKDVNHLYNFMLENEINTTILPPALLRMFPHKPLPALKTLVIGGDSSDRETMNYWSKGRQLINAYGPTEITVAATTLEYDENKRVNEIGRPLQNIKLYVLDTHSQPLPIGIPGELLIGGISLARGYLNQSELTSEKFITNPFASPEDQSEGKNLILYKTGDLVRWLANGNLEFIGRIDNQVKIRGFRIELGEIEATLARHAGISKCVVRSLLGRNGQKQLVAYYVPTHTAKTTALSHDALRASLGKNLPDYMIPAVFIPIKEIPLFPSGKVDTKKLPSPERLDSIVETKLVAPRNEIEQSIVEIWADVLKIKKISIKTNFFSLGGNSLDAIQVISRLNQIFETNLPVRLLFEHATVEELATVVGAELTHGKSTAQTIAKVSRDQRRFLLSFAQQRLWFLDQYEDSPFATYNIPIVTKLIGHLNIAALEKSLNYLITRHESFRTSFKNEAGKGYQEILPEYHLKLTAEPIHANDLLSIVAEEVHKRFNLQFAPLMRVRLLKLDKDQHVLMITQHHIISDGWSVGVLIKELTEVYQSLLHNLTPHLPELPIQYIDFACWQRTWLQGKILQDQLDYWRKKLENHTDFELPTDFPRPKIKTYNGNHYQFVLDQKLTDDLQKLTKENKATLFITLLAAFNVLLCRYSGQEDIIIGSPIAGRIHPDVENTIGFFVNTLALRGDLSGNPSFIDFLAKMKRTCLEAYRHQDLPFEYLVDELNVPRDPSRHPIFQVMFVVRDLEEMAVIGLEGIKTCPVKYESRIAKFDLIFDLFFLENGLGCEIEYNTDLYAEESIQQLAQHFKVLLKNIVADPQTKIHELSILTAAEQQHILIDWNQTQHPLPQKTIQELFEEQVAKSPNHIALVYEKQHVTYHELNAKVNQLAHTIRKLYLKEFNQTSLRDSMIGLCTERSLEMIIGILAIIKAGAAYVPIDPAYPEQRIKFMLQDTKTLLLLTQTKVLQKLKFIPETIRHYICLDDQQEKASSKNLTCKNTLNDLCYVIYTSGSTGVPKGVMIEQRGVINLVHDQQQPYRIQSPTDRVLQFASISFDGSVIEIFTTLLKAAILYIVPELIRRDVNSLYNYMLVNDIKIATIPPALLKLFPHKLLPALKILNVAGESCDKVTMNYWSKGRLLTNVYGPTENTVATTICNYDENKRVNEIGRPLQNIKLYVLDTHSQPLPIGIPGELLIGGISLARGYLNQSELTSEKFITNPFASPEDQSEGKNLILYKTGDLVRWLANGNLEFIGRIDNQVKIRGFRIELGEIEEILAQQKGISKCVVRSHVGQNGQKQLVAYYVPTKTAKEKELSTEALRENLGKKLPDYMIPAVFIRIKEIPLSPGGKVDIKKLPSPEGFARIVETKFVAPRNEIEKSLIEIWSNILKVKNIGVNDSFFVLGGNSLLAIQTVFKINEKFNTNFSVGDFFKFPIVSRMAEMIKAFISGTEIDKRTTSEEF